MKRLLCLVAVLLAGSAQAQIVTFPPSGGSGGAGDAPAISAATYCADAGANDTYACNLSPAITSYVAGLHVCFKANTANTGAASINFNTVGALTIKKTTPTITTDVETGDILAGQTLCGVYDGTNFLMTSPLASPRIERVSGVVLDPAGARDIVVWRAPVPCTVVAVRGYTTGGTNAVINARKNGTDALLASDLTATAGSWTSQTTIQNASFAIGDSLEVRIISLSGSPTAVAIQVECTRR